MFESCGAVDFSGVGTHLIQDIELVLVTSTLVGGIFFTKVMFYSTKIDKRDLGVSTNKKFQNSLVDEHILILQMHIMKIGIRYI